MLLRRAGARHLVARPLRTAITVAGVAMAVALAVAVGIVSDTLNRSLSVVDRDPGGGSDLVALASDGVGLPQGEVERVRGLPGVRGVAPVLRGVARVSGPHASASALVFGIDRRATFAMAPHRERLVVRSGSPDPNGPGLLVSGALANAIGARVGNAVTFASPAGRSRVPGLGTISGSGVGGLSGARVALLQLPAAQRVLGRPGRVDALYLSTDPGARGTVEREVAQRLRGIAIVGRPGALAHDAEGALRPLTTLTSLAAVAAFFVGLCLVYTTLTVAIAERRHELATMLALGSRRREVGGAFLLEGALVGVAAAVAGVAMGIVLGGVLVRTSGFTPPLPGATEMVVTPLRLVLAGVTGIAVSVLAAAIAVARVGRLEPLASLRPSASLEAVSRPRRIKRWMPVAAAVACAALGAACLAVAVSSPDRTWLATVTMALWLVVTTLMLPRTTPLGVRVLRRLFARPIGPPARLAFDALDRNPRRTALTTGAVAVTTGLLIAVTASSQSYRADFARKAEAASSAPLYVTTPRDAGPLAPPLPAALVDRVRTVPGVGAAYPERQLITRVDGRPAVLTATAPTADGRSYVHALRDGDVALSRYTARVLHVGVGDRVGVMTPRGRLPVRVAAVFAGTLSFCEVHALPSTVGRAWGDDHATRIAVVPAHGTPPLVLARRLQGAVGANGSTARVATGRSLASDDVAGLDAVLGPSRAVQIAYLAIAVLAVVNTMFLSIVERRWELGLQRTLGMSRGEIAGSLVVEAGSIGYLGGWGGAAFGTAAGYAMTRAMDQGFGWNVAFHVPPVMVVLTIAGAALMAAIAALPALRVALRATIATTLRGDVTSVRAMHRFLVFRAILRRSSQPGTAGGGR